MVKQSNKTQISGIAATLSQCALFASLSSEKLMQVAALGEIESFKKGETITRAGEVMTGIYVIQSGLVYVISPATVMHQKLTSILHPGMCFALAAMGTDKCALVSATAFDSVRLIYIPSEPLVQLYKTIPELPVTVPAALCEYIRHLITRAERAKGRTIEMRLAAWLLEQPIKTLDDVHTHAKAFDGIGRLKNAATEIQVITMCMRKGALAAELGVTQQSLSRTFQRFRKRGLILSKQKYIYLLNRAEIEAWALES